MKGATGGYVTREPDEGIFDRALVRALEDLREAAGMNCEQLPEEVREALHRIPGIDKTHKCAFAFAVPLSATD